MPEEAEALGNEPTVAAVQSDNNSPYLDSMPQAAWRVPLLSIGRIRPVLIGAVSVVIALGIWQVAVAQKWANPLFLASPTQIWDELVRLFSSGSIWIDLAVSGEEFGLGIGLALIVGILGGIAFGRYRIVSEVLNPFVTSLYATPRIALVPVLILWLGIGISSKVAIVFLSSVFEIFLNSAVGVRTVDANMTQLARSYGASEFRLFSTVIMPHSVPYVLTGARMAVGRGLVGMVVGELFAAQHGVGKLLVQSADNFDTPTMYAAIVIIMVAGVILTYLVAKLERHFQAWRTD